VTVVVLVKVPVNSVVADVPVPVVGVVVVVIPVALIPVLEGVVPVSLPVT
jgi:hypothetical protein